MPGTRRTIFSRATEAEEIIDVKSECEDPRCRELLREILCGCDATVQAMMAAMMRAASMLIFKDRHDLVRVVRRIRNQPLSKANRRKFEG